MRVDRRAKTVQFARSLLQPTVQVAIEKCNDLDTNPVQVCDLSFGCFRPNLNVFSDLMS